jgi:indolepyruvate ferredoxin oxidoreductase
VLGALSVQRKISLRSWFRPVFRLLVAMAPGARHPSGPLRRRPRAEVEREPVVEYERTVAEPPAALDVARLPDVVRGFEEIKLDNLAAYRSSERLG